MAVRGTYLHIFFLRNFENRIFNIYVSSFLIFFINTPPQSAGNFRTMAISRQILVGPTGKNIFRKLEIKRKRLRTFSSRFGTIFFPGGFGRPRRSRKKSVIFSPSKTFPIDLIVLLSFSAWSETAKKGVFDPILGRKSAKVAF